MTTVSARQARQAARVDRLLVEHAPAPPMVAAATRIGGWPLMPRGAPWPACEGCGGAMQFLLQVRLADLGPVHPAWSARDGVLSVWQCRDPRWGCGGPGVARIAPLDGLEVVAGDALGAPMLRCRGLEPRPIARAGGDDPFPRVVREAERVRALVSRSPAWVGAPVEASCCGAAMTPVLQLHDEGDVGYVLACEGCDAAVWRLELDGS